MTILTENRNPVGSRFARRALLRGLAAAVPMALLAPHKVYAATVWDGHAEWGQEEGVWYAYPAGRSHAIPWPTTSDLFPDPEGWMGADRTVVTIKRPGIWLVTWNVTFNPNGGRFLKTALEADLFGEGWRDIADGNELPPTRGDETTLTGLAYLRSNGATRFRINAMHDLDKPLRITDRSYECHLHVAPAGVAA